MKMLYPHKMALMKHGNGDVHRTRHADTANNLRKSHNSV